jgi:ethylbenzene dioxygenase ferredoxin subunit
MAHKVFLIHSTELAPGCIKKIEAGGCELAVYNLEGEFFATQNMCTHATASLAEGEILDGDLITCPVHDGQFHIPTGQAVTFPCTVDLRTYKVIQEDGKVYADLDAQADAAAAAI